jgi:LPS-assembly protein
VCRSQTTGRRSLHCPWSSLLTQPTTISRGKGAKNSTISARPGRSHSRGHRADINPGVSLNFKPAGIFEFVPFANARGTFYRTYAGDKQSFERETYNAGAALSTKAARVFHLDPEGEGIQKLQHLIKPELTYNFIPDKDQSNLPYFDGTDRIKNLNRVEFSLTNSIFGKVFGSGSTRYLEYVQLKGSSSYDVGEATRGLKTAEDRRKPLSPLDALLLVQNSRGILFQGNALTGFYSEGLYYLSGFANLPDSRGDSIGAGYSYYRLAGELKYASAAATINLFDRFYAHAMARYFMNNSKWLEYEYGGKYISTCGACWSLDLTYSRRWRTPPPDDINVYVQLTLKGIGTVGSKEFTDSTQQH